MQARGKKFEAKTGQFIHGIQLKQLRWIPDELGKLIELLRCENLKL